MRTSLFIQAALLGLALIAGADEAAAQSCSRRVNATSGMDAEDKLRELDRNDCLGRARCDSAVCKVVRPTLEEALPKPPDDRKKVAEALRAVLSAASNLPQDTEPGERVLSRMGIDLARFVEDGRPRAARWGVDDLILFADEPYEVNLPMWLGACMGQPDCTQRFHTAQEIVELARLFGRILTKAREEERNAFGAHLDRLDQQWRAYLGSSRGQYPWELAVNSWHYRKTAAFDAAPTSQLIFLHPGVAYELTKTASDRQPSESLLLELAGIYRWSWSDEAKMRQRLGGSFTLAWRDAGEARSKLGYGVLIYLPRATTLGYVFRPQDGDNEHVLVLSADLVKFLRQTDGLKEKLIGGSAKP